MNKTTLSISDNKSIACPRLWILAAVGIMLGSIATVSAAPTESLYWNPSEGSDPLAGGSGSWNSSDPLWLTSSTTPYAWVPGLAGSMATYNTLYFGANGQAAGETYNITTSVDNILAPDDGGVLYYVNLRFQGNYKIQTSAAAGTTIGSNGNVALNIYSGTGKTVSFDGAGSGITLISGCYNSGGPGIMFAGGGNFELGQKVAVKQASANARITIGEAGSSPTVVSMLDQSTLISGYRLWLDNGILNMNSGSMSFKNTQTNAERSAVFIGNVAASTAPSTFNLNAGLVMATANEAHHGILFGGTGATSGKSGGTFNLNGGLLTTTDIVSEDTTGNTTAIFVFNGGTLNVATEATSNQLNRFIRGLDGSLNKLVRIDAGGAFIDTSNASSLGTATISSPLTGVGGLTKLGTKSLKLASANTYLGTTAVAGGVLELGVADAIAPSGTVAITAGATLDAGGFDQTLQHLSGAGLVTMGAGNLTLANIATSTFSGTITRDAVTALTKTGAGTFILGTGANLGGGILVSDGGLQGDSVTLTSALTAINTDIDGRVIFNESTDANYTGVISGAGKIEKIGSGTLTLATAQNYTGGVIVTAGAIRGDSTSLLGDIATNAAVIFNETGAGVYAGTMSGTGSLEKTGTGELTFSAASQHTGMTAVSEGTLKVGIADAFAASSSVQVANNARFDSGDFDQTMRNLTGAGTLAMGAGSLTAEVTADTTTTFAGVIAGSGGLTKIGAGTLVLTGANTFSGDVAVNQGALLIDSVAAQLTGDITVAPLATFGGAGTVGAAGQTLTLAAGSTLQLGTPGSLSAQTLTVNSNLLFTNAILAVDLFANNDNDRLLLGPGAGLNASGNNTIDIGNFTSGTFNLGNLAALKTDSASLTITLRGQSAEGGRQSIASGTTAAGDLVLTTIASKSREMVWTGSASALWNTADTGWNDNLTPGDANQFASGDRVIFDGASDAGNETNRHITIQGAYVTVSDMTVRGDASYAFDGAAIIADADSVIDVPDTLTGATGKLFMQGTGTLTLAPVTGTNHFKGGVEFQSGVLALDSLGALGDSAITITGDAAVPVTLRIESNAHNIELGGPIDLGSKGLTIDTQANDATLAAALTGATGGDLIKTGAGALTLAAAGHHLGAVDIREGTLRTGADYAFSHSSSVHIAAGATLDLDNFSQRASNLHGAGLITLGTSAATVFHAVITTDADFSGTLSGAGSFAKDGAATLTLGGSLAHTGTTAVLAGTLKLTAADALASNSAVAIGVGTLDLGDQNQTLKNLQGSGTLIHGTAVLTVESTEDTEFFGPLAVSAGGATGQLIKTGTATLTLGGENAFTGGATIANGTVIARHIAALGSGPITLSSAGAGLCFDGAVGELAQTITGAGSTIDFTGGSRVRLAAANTLGGLRASGGGTVVTAAHPGALGGPAATVTISSLATLEIAAQNVQAGSMTIAGGTLLFALNENAEPAGSLATGSLIFSNAAEITFAGPVASGRYALATGNINMGVKGTDYIYDPSQYGVQITIDEGGNMIAYKQSFNPSKDLALLYDSIIASTSVIYSRMSESFLLPLVERTQYDKYNGLWFKAMGSFADYETNEIQIGHRDHSYGVIVGYDMTTRSKRFLAGLYAGASNAHIDAADGASMDGAMQFAGVYGSALFGTFYIGTDISGGWMKADTQRPEGSGKVSGNYDLDYFAGSAEMGFVLRLWEKGALRPAASLHYMNARFHDQHEYGTGALHVDDFSNDVVQSFISLQAFQEFKLPWGWNSMVDAMFGWRQTLAGNGATVSGAFANDAYTVFTMDTKGYVPGSTVIGFGFRTSVTRGIILGLRYDLEATSGRNRHAASGSLTFRW